MEIRSEPSGNDITRITLSGRMDVPGNQSIELRFIALSGTPGARIVVDLSGVSFLVSIGLRTLVTNAKVVRQRGGRMVLLNPQPIVGAVLDQANVGAIIPIFDDFDVACQYLRADFAAAAR